MPADYERHVDLAQRAVEGQRYRIAAEHWAKAATLAQTPNDRHEAVFRQASNLRKSGDEAKYWTLLGQLARSPGPRRARAAYELARRDYEAASSDNGAALERVLVAFPDSAHAKAALDLLLSKQSQETRYETLAHLEPQVRDAATLHEYLQVSQARLAEQLGDDATAIRLYGATIERYPYPVGRYWDRALLRQAVLYARQGDRQSAIGALSYMVSHQESARLFGTYMRVYGPARLLWARLLVNDDWQAAHRALSELVEADDESRLIDDALWAAALLAKQNTATEQACADADQLRQRRPASRYVPCLNMVCATIQPESECRRYIKEKRSDAKAVLDLMLEPFIAPWGEQP